MRHLPRQARKAGREENAFRPRSGGLGGGALQIGIARGLLAFCCIVGTIPGSVYGWPEECWKGSTANILDINSALPAHFVIANGIVAMEGNGPLQGTARDPAWGREGSGVTNGQPMASYTQGGPAMTSAERVDCASLRRGSLLYVQTRNRHYWIQCLAERRSALPVIQSTVRLLRPATSWSPG